MMDNTESDIFQVSSGYAGDSVVVCFSAELVGCHMTGVHFHCVASGQKFSHLKVQTMWHFFLHKINPHIVQVFRNPYFMSRNDVLSSEIFTSQKLVFAVSLNIVLFPKPYN